MVNSPLIRPYLLGVNVALGGSGPLGSHDIDPLLKQWTWNRGLPVFFWGFWQHLHGVIEVVGFGFMGGRKMVNETQRGCFALILVFVFWVMFYRLYHGKSPFCTTIWGDM